MFKKHVLSVNKSLKSSMINSQNPFTYAAKVAVMFLTRGPMPHEVLWADWLRAANGLMPVEGDAQAGALASPQQCSSAAPGTPFVHAVHQVWGASRHHQYMILLVSYLVLVS